jgi:hypothetical protein
MNLNEFHVFHVCLIIPEGWRELTCWFNCITSIIRWGPVAKPILIPKGYKILQERTFDNELNLTTRWSTSNSKKLFLITFDNELNLTTRWSTSNSKKLQKLIPEERTFDNESNLTTRWSTSNSKKLFLIINNNN